MGGMIKCKLCKSQHMAAIRDSLSPHLLLWQLMIKMFRTQPPKSLVEEPYCSSKEFTRKQHKKTCIQLHKYSTTHEHTMTPIGR